MPEGAAISRMFAGIAGRYDTANHLLSFGQDFRWRRRLAQMVKALEPRDVVDLATGSGDVAFTLRQTLPPFTAITGLDFCQPMLDQAEAKKSQRPGTENLRFAFGDCMNLPLGDASVDAVTISFGLRNFEDRARGMGEMLRVLRPGGAAFILEFSQPSWWMKPFYYAYLKGILPLMARVATGNRDAYEYLGDSIEKFPARSVFSQQLLDAGFAEVKAVPMTGGIVAIHQARA
ncbi:bifunctional demethylmenaquinone methyltransferase/2-methoxy-6-polyprenyl-1,4-benzoquinol methylase UbiE [Ruficoccus amylovorans]|uniref:Demethylmenaquinone methyltransferase n=1 Tax=Ruficoccus amylovorans TaxID=1804625 RepID=A0A842HD36_9BACT|nr:bifunctional demethylmenaquinone methyltransferase/2-methoxy-6-polyprenyl-1,4-benzoquinol methylase UbiE [Ruficoccus amylovorans]MBC2594150.1 bifunctional demethylmenaquinone methyltransferase/2-methoxy-6-polyprenyl-1,4-benzoquinol methylase UbiE [Ruficoccus amylovorans]